MLQSVSTSKPIEIMLIRSVEDLNKCDALIIPGGGVQNVDYMRLRIFTVKLESTTIALLARLAGLTEPLREFIAKKPVWGTCAGAILLSEEAEGTKKGGQELLGGVTIKTKRNGWGSQVSMSESHEIQSTE